MTTEAVTTLDSGDAMPEMGSVSSEIAPGSFERYLDAVSFLGLFQVTIFEASLDAMSSDWRHEIDFWDKTPIQPSLITTSAEKLYPPVSWPYALHNVGAGSPFNGQWLERAREMRQAYALRIKELHRYATDDGIQLNPDSERDFWSFMDSIQIANRAGLILMDNGNLRAVWQGAESSHVGIQFLGEQKVEYVVFKRRTDSDDVSRVAGIDTLNGVKKRIRAFGLASLVNV